MVCAPLPLSLLLFAHSVHSRHSMRWKVLQQDALIVLANKSFLCFTTQDLCYRACILYIVTVLLWRDHGAPVSVSAGSCILYIVTVLLWRDHGAPVTVSPGSCMLYIVTVLLWRDHGAPVSLSAGLLPKVYPGGKSHDPLFSNCCLTPCHYGYYRKPTAGACLFMHAGNGGYDFHWDIFAHSVWASPTFWSHSLGLVKTSVVVLVLAVQLRSLCGGLLCGEYEHWTEHLFQI